jgi:hypothetical protein
VKFIFHDSFMIKFYRMVNVVYVYLIYKYEYPLTYI